MAARPSASPRDSLPVQRAADILSARPSVIATDFDGTLSEIVPSPGDATILPRARRALTALRDRVDQVIVVSGRELSGLRYLVGIDGLVYAGNHGLDWDGPAGLEPADDTSGERQRMAELARRLSQALARLPGVWVENKGLTVSVHYRNAPDSPGLMEQVRRAVEDAAEPRHRLRPARMAIEVLPGDLAGKERFVERVLNAVNARGFIAIGDDVSDLELLRLARARAGAGLPSLAVGVMSSEAPPDLRNAADVILDGPVAVASWLMAVATALSR